MIHCRIRLCCTEAGSEEYGRLWVLAIECTGEDGRVTFKDSMPIQVFLCMYEQDSML